VVHPLCPGFDRPFEVQAMLTLRNACVAATVFGLGLARVDAAVIHASGCSSSDVQAAINSASGGDTVVLPPSCVVTWNSGVSIPESKGITLNGNSARVARGSLGNGSPLIDVGVNATTWTRVTGFTFTDSKASNGLFILIDGGDETSPKFRIDHCSFTAHDMGVHIKIGAPVYGVIDHNSFTWDQNSEVIHNEAYGATSTAGWTNDVVPGSANAVYIEDNTFTNETSGNPAYFWGGSAVQGYYGSRTVFRYNQVEMATVDMHGTPGMIGARWWEIYENTFHVVDNGDIDKIIGMRGGSGVIFNNRKIGRTDYKGEIVLYEEDSGYPALYQIGRGKNQSLDPTYAWNNDAVARSGSSNVQLNRDFYLSPKPGYKPYTYPHPMTASPHAPMNLRIVP
jgi:hypothetical protein